MNNITLFLIIAVFGIYKIFERWCELKETEIMENTPSEELSIIDKLIDENMKLTDRLLKGEGKDE